MFWSSQTPANLEAVAGRGRRHRNRVYAFNIYATFRGPIFCVPGRLIGFGRVVFQRPFFSVFRGVRRRLRLVLHRPSRAESDLIAETTCLTGKLKAQIERCRSAFFAAAPDVGRQDPDPRPCTAAGNGPPSAPVGFEPVAGKIRPGGILQAPDVPQSESNGQRSLEQTKTCRAKTSNCLKRSISRTEIHSGSGRTISNKVRFPSQSVSAERICRPVSLSDACGDLFVRFGSTVMELRAADLG